MITIDLLRELYSYELYFLTKEGFDLGDKKWLERNEVNLLEPNQTTYKNILNIFRRILRKKLSYIPGLKISVRNNKMCIVIKIEYTESHCDPLIYTTPVLPGLESIYPPPITSSVRIVPKKSSLQIRGLYFEGSGYVYPTHNVISVQMGFNTYIAQLDREIVPRYIRRHASVQEARGSAKVLASTSFIDIINFVEMYVTYLDSIMEETKAVLEADILDILHTKSIERPIDYFIEKELV